MNLLRVARGCVRVCDYDVRRAVAIEEEIRAKEEAVRQRKRGTTRPVVRQQTRYEALRLE